ncbi:MAG: CHAD domain-containing protein, partial [Acidimicrobiales bacterium]
LTPLVDQLRHDCSLQPALLSKFEVGLLAAGLTIPTIPDLGPTALGRNPTIGALTVAVLRRHVAAMLTHEAGTRLGEDIEELHDMRVATRRLRAALALFDEFLPEESDHLREELGWLADELGAVRDLDVQISRLDGWREELSSTHGATLADLGRLLERERDKIREGLLASLDSPRYERLVARFIDLVSPGIGHASERARSDAEQPATTVVPELVTARYRAVTAAARRARRSGDPADLHRLRIRTKRLRYALEFVSDIYGKRTKRLTRQMVQLQDCLGIIQDAEVAADRLHTLALRSDGGLSPATVFAMGGVAERYRRDAATAVDAVPGHLRALKGRDWHTLEKYMERKRDRGGEVCEEPEAGGPESGTGPAAHRGAGVDRTGPWGPRSATALLGSTPRSIADPPDDGEWDRADTQVLRSLPDPTGPEDETPDPGENHPPPLFQSPDLGAGDRRKEPVFLPSSARPGPGRPGSVPPTPPTEPPGRTDNRTFYDRP